jgi:hypothetical protein
MEGNMKFKLTKTQTADLIASGDIVSIKGRQFISLEALDALDVERPASHAADQRRRWWRR